MNQLILVELILELCPEVDHESVRGTGLNSTSVCGSTIGEFERLHSGWILNEFVHKSNVVEATGINGIINLLGNGGVIQTKGVNWKLRKGHYNEYNSHDDDAAETATKAGH